MGKDLLKKGERLDDLHRNGYMLIQDPEKFCFGLDAVLLSGFAKAKPGEIVMDLCSGNGIVPILMEAKTGCDQFVGVEIQADNVDMARRSIKYNKLEDRIFMECCDLKELGSIYNAHMFDVVTCNPPYIKAKSGAVNDIGGKAIARHEIMCTLDDVFAAAAKMLKYGGRLYMVHRTNRLADIFELSKKHRLEPKVMRFVHACIDKAPSMVLIEFAKDGKPHLEVQAPMIIYAAGNVYTKEVNDIFYN
ncbi:MAG: tRNA1(Val) (adenine(37)-N6)-methyltransferase [Firmicutes bacterium]|nr:tRNA1(Val) (adenine(37)-N6)-methyltransferase [Bacillota bacterium]